MILWGSRRIERKDDCYAACFSIGSLPDYLKEKAELISKAGAVTKAPGDLLYMRDYTAHL